MSAVNFSSDDDDQIEALRRAQRAHEPSMEEILASIRNIITDEREQAKRPMANPPDLRAAASGPQTQERAESEPRPPGEAGRDASAGVGAARGEPAAEDDAGAGAPTSSEEDEPLVSADTDQAVMTAFEALSVGLRARTAEVAGEMIVELLRPMLKDWLDENLPRLVDRLVRAEIERMGRPFR
jgi:cell pole-organizing protein PopZ